VSTPTVAAPSIGVLRVLVVDDEPLGRQRVLELLESADVEVVGAAADGIQAVEAIRALKPDVVFLDVQMPRMSGLEVVREIGHERMPVTVFVTAFDQYAINAFDLSAIDYLVKPFRDDRFREALSRARERAQSENVVRLHEQLLALLQSGSATVAQPPVDSAPKYLDRIAVQMRGKVRVVRVAQIDCITAAGPYVDLHVGNHRLVIRESLQTLSERLDPAMFLRIHRSTIVRLDLIETLLRHEGSEYEVQLKNGVRLRVGRSRLEALEKRLGDFL
jgi:two-component system, LytTR family, response regulator